MKTTLVIFAVWLLFTYVVAQKLVSTVEYEFNSVVEKINER